MGFRAEGVGLARLEIACSSPGQPSPAPIDLLHWLRNQRSPRSVRVRIAIDPVHTARAVILARIGLGSQGIRVGPVDLPTCSPSERRKLLRDALRLTLWRATGSTGAWLVPQIVARKRADCGV